MDINENIVTCEKCGEKFIPTKPNISGGKCGQPCPHCKIWTPIPFLVFRRVGGKFPGEE